MRFNFISINLSDTNMNKFSKPTSYKTCYQNTYISVCDKLQLIHLVSVTHTKSWLSQIYLSDNLNYWVSESYAALNDQDEKPKCASLRFV